MKFLILLTILTTFNVSASLYSQETKLSLSVEGKTLKETLRIIEGQSNFRFFYSDDFQDINKVVTLKAKNQKIDDIMSSILSLSTVTYKILDNNVIVITPVSNPLPAQPYIITGQVVDVNSGGPLPGVNILVKGSLIGTISGIDGRYSLEVPGSESILVFSFVGYQTQEVLVGNQTQINISLRESVRELDEIIIVGYGRQKKANLTGSVSSVTSDKLENRQATSASLALAGELSGVSVRQLSGNPRKSEGQIIVRGLGTFSSAGNAPLVLVDGIPSSIDRVDPNDIQSVSVLKDAASAAIYGSQAANGVILVETKKGEAGKMKFNYYSYVGVQKATMLPEMAPSWIYAEAYNEAARNMGASTRFTDEDIQKYKSGTDPDYPNYDHIGTVWNSGKGLQTKHGMSMSGGTELTQYNFSLSYLNHQGIIINNDMQDYNIRLNLSSNISNKLKFTTSISANQTNGRQPGEGDAVAESGIGRATRAALRLNNTIIGKRDDGYFGHMETVHYSDLWSPSFFSDKSLYLFGTSDLEWEVFKDFSVSGRLGYTNTAYESKSFRADYFVTPTYRISPNLLDQRWSKGDVLTVQSLMNYNKSFGDHSIILLGGFEQMEFNSSNIRAQRENFPNNDLTEISAGSTINAINSGSASRRKLRSYFGRANYNYDDRYLIEANLRYDGSSRFPKETRWGLFPSFSAAWRISQESFFEDIVPWIYDLKIRGSWGELGNQSVGNYPYQNLISLSPQAPIGNVIQPGAAVTTIPNKNITWETTRVSDIGLDLVVWDGKIALTADYYKRLTYDILYSLSRSMMLGANASPVNAGKVENKGFDFELTHRNKYGDFSYSVSGNLGINRNKVIYLEGVEQDIGRGLFIGHPIGSIYGYEADGLFVDEADVQNWPDQSVQGAEPGLIRFKDLSGPDGIPDGLISAAYDRTIIGQPIPITTYGLSLNANYKGFFLAALFQGEGGRVSTLSITPQTVGMRHWHEFGNDGNIQQFIWDTRWTPDNPDRNAGWPKLGIGGEQIANRITSSFWFKDATFLRLKNLQIGYNIPQKYTTRLRINNVRIYANGENLFTIHNYWPNWDPEMLSENIVQGWYPLTRTLLFGINVDF